MSVRDTGGRGGLRSGDEARVHAAWDRIETWLAANAPRTLATLSGPADEDDVRGAERALEVTFPPGLVASLRRHNGVRGETPDGNVDPAAFCLPSEDRLLSTEEIVARTRFLRSVQGDDAGAGAWWHPGYVQIGSYDITADGTVVDCREGDGHGRTGAFSRTSGTDFTGPASLGLLLAATADALQQGRGTLIDLDEEEIDEDDPDAAPLAERAVIWD